MVKLLEGKSAIVTGAAQGIGFAVAQEFALHGCDVLGCDINEASMSQRDTTSKRRSGAPWRCSGRSTFS
jgi:3-oxoacyl-[acyl-carrier protein] reductase